MLQNLNLTLCLVLAAASSAAGAQAPTSALERANSVAPAAVPPAPGKAPDLKALNPQPLPPIGLLPAEKSLSTALPAGPGAGPNPRALNPQPLPPLPTGQAPLQALAVKEAPSLPSNLFSLEEKAIIIVGGKPVKVGDVRNELRAELKRQSGPAKVFTIPARKLMPVKSAGALGAGAMGDLKAPVSPRMSSELARDKPLQLPDCRSEGPSITRIHGGLSPGGKITITGRCLGDQVGGVELIGQFPGGNLKLTFSEWNGARIVAAVPTVRGAADHAVALTVVRAGDKKRSPAQQTQFVATRERVAVPGHLWVPGPQFTPIEVVQSGGNVFSGYTVVGTGGPAAHRMSNQFRVAVNPACALDTMEAVATTGAVHGINGWDRGAPHEGNVQLVWSPRCIRQTTNYLVASSTQSVCSALIELRTWAHCPLGVSP